MKSIRFLKGILIMFMGILFLLNCKYAQCADEHNQDEDKLLSESSAASALHVQPVIHDNYAKTRVLVIDGGGIRGIYAAAVLQKLEEDSGKRICDIFQGGITGTSTGSFIALALAASKHKVEGSHEFVPGPYPAEEIVKFYKSMGQNIFKCWTPSNCWENASACPTSCWGTFTHSVWNMFCCFGCFGCCKNCNGWCGPKYSNAALQSALMDRFGDLLLSDVLVPVQVVAYDIEQNTPMYFNSADHPTFKMRDVALASSAAPTYFPPVIIRDGIDEMHCIDGGIFDNSAGIAALRYASERYSKIYGVSPPSLRDFVLVSIGTGSKIKPSRFNRLHRSGKLGWAHDAVDISMLGASQAAEVNLERILPASSYFRIQTNLEATGSSLDDVKQIKKLIGRARAAYSPSSRYATFIEVHIKRDISRELNKMGDSALMSIREEHGSRPPPAAAMEDMED